MSEESMKRLGIYIHIPFCIRKCNYCDFCSYAHSDKKIMFDYAHELCRRMIEFSDAHCKDVCVDTVYFGGGTPTLLPVECFEALFKTLYEHFRIEDNAEITVECNPASIGLEGLRALRVLGANRLSIGLQSANEIELKELGRLHSFDDFCKVYDDAKMAGFDNISVDLMYGIPHQTIESFEHTLYEICRLAPSHISAYGLKIEEGTVFDKRRSELVLPDEDQEYEMYNRCVEILCQNGYKRYEISNFAKDGRESRHNLRYWELKDYIGFGVAAHSCFDRERFGNSRDIKNFLLGNDITEERYVISDEEQIREFVMLGLRLGKGIGLQEYAQLSGCDFKSDFPMIDGLVREVFLWEENGRVGFTTKGFFVSNAILAQMLNFE